MTPPSRRLTTNSDPDGDSLSEQPTAQRPPVPPPVQAPRSIAPEPVAPPVQAQTPPAPVQDETQAAPESAKPAATKPQPSSHNGALMTAWCLLALVAGGAAIAIYHAASKQEEPITVAETEPREKVLETHEIDPEAGDFSAAMPDTVADDGDKSAESTSEVDVIEGDVIAAVANPQPGAAGAENKSTKPDETNKSNPQPPPKRPAPVDPKSNPLAYVKLVRDAHERCKTLAWETTSNEGFKAMRTLLQYASEVMALQQDSETEEGLRVIALGPVTDALVDIRRQDWPPEEDIARLNQSSLAKEAGQRKAVFAFTRVVRSTRGIPLVEEQPALLLEAIGTGDLIVYPLADHLLVKKGTKFLVFGIEQAEEVELDLTEYAAPVTALLVRGNHLYEQVDKPSASARRINDARLSYGSYFRSLQPEAAMPNSRPGRRLIAVGQVSNLSNFTVVRLVTNLSYRNCQISLRRTHGYNIAQVPLGKRDILLYRT